MRTYEGLFVFDPSLSTEAVQEAIATVEGVITKREGRMIKRVDRGRINLGYEIKKKKDGFSHVLYFTITPTALTAIDYEIRLMSGIVKFSIFRCDEKDVPVAAEATPGQEG